MKDFNVSPESRAEDNLARLLDHVVAAVAAAAAGFCSATITVETRKEEVLWRQGVAS